MIGLWKKRLYIGGFAYRYMRGKEVIPKREFIFLLLSLAFLVYSYVILLPNTFHYTELTQDKEDGSACSLDFWSGGRSSCNLTIDENWSTYGNPMDDRGVYVLENFTKSYKVTAAKFYAKFSIGDHKGITFSIFNYSSNSWEILHKYSAYGAGDSFDTFDIPITSLRGEVVQIKTSFRGQKGWSAYYEGEMIWTMKNITISTILIFLLPLSLFIIVLFSFAFKINKQELKLKLIKFIQDIKKIKERNLPFLETGLFILSIMLLIFILCYSNNFFIKTINQDKPDNYQQFYEKGMQEYKAHINEMLILLSLSMLITFIVSLMDRSKEKKPKKNYIFLKLTFLIFVSIILFYSLSIKYQDSYRLIVQKSNETVCAGGWSTGNPCSNTIDNNWSTFGSPFAEAYVWENYTIPRNTVLAKLNVKVGIGDRDGVRFQVWNYSSKTWDLLYWYPNDNSGIQNGSLYIPRTSLKGNKVQIRTTLWGV